MHIDTYIQVFNSKEESENKLTYIMSDIVLKIRCLVVQWTNESVHIFSAWYSSNLLLSNGVAKNTL